MTGAAPRVLLVTDADLSVGSRGAGRTLVNLVSRYPADALLVLNATLPPATPFTMESGHRVLGAATGIPGRIAHALQRTVGDASAAWMGARPTPHHAAVARFGPQLVLGVPVGNGGLALTARCRPFAPLVTYLMDDWLAHAQGPHLAFDARRRGRALLRDSAAWLAISPALLASMRTFAGVDRPAHIVHNPVALDGGEPAALTAPRTGRFRVAYAGSVWPMHHDAVTAVAQGVQRLRAGGIDIEFVLFTDRHFWGRYLEDWTRWGVVDGGLVPYAALGAALGGCDLLLVASSFDPAQAHMSRSSVQTKVTDYMAAGRPILACGPPDAASNEFLRRHASAYFAEDIAPAAIDAALRACVASRAGGPALARHAWDVVRSEHEMGAVTGRLYEFLARVAAGEQGA